MDKFFTLPFLQFKQTSVSVSKKIALTFSILLVVLLMWSKGIAQPFSLTPGTLTYSQDFNAYTGAAATGNGLDGAWSVTCPNFRGKDNGSSNTGGAWSYGVTGGSDFAAGYLGSGSSGTIRYNVSFINNTGSTITSLNIEFDFEQWRIVSPASAGNTQGFTVTGTGVLGASLSALNTTSVNAGTPPLTTHKTLLLTGLTIANGATFGIQWAGSDGANADNGIAIDNFSLTVPVPCVNPNITTDVTPASQAVCTNDPSSTIRIASVGTSKTYQWYSSATNVTTGGTIIGGATDSFYVPPTATTRYYYCVVTACTNKDTSSASAVIVTAPPVNSTISYSGSPYCSSDNTSKLVTRTGAAGGTYSSAAGLSLNTATGAINPFLSTPGTYTITYTVTGTGGCGDKVTNTDVTITTVPSATISYASPVCKTGGVQTVTLIGTTGGTFTSTAGLTINATTGTITASTSTEGTYIVTYTMTAPGNGCVVDQTTTTSVVISSTVTTVSPAASQDIAAFVNGTTLTVSEGGPIVSRQWKYGTIAGGPYTTNLGTAITQIPNFASLGTYYIVCETTYPAAPCGGGVVRSNEVEINVTNNLIAVTAATYGPFCNDVNNNVTVDFTYSPAVNFTAGSTVFTAQLSSGTGSFAAPVNIGTVVSDASSGQSIAATIPAGVTGGTAFRIRVVSTGPNTTGTTNGSNFIIGGYPSAVISYPGSPFCKNSGIQAITRTGTTGGSYSSTAGLVINSTTGNITTGASTAGTYTVTYTMPAVGTCPSQTTTTTVTITAVPVASIAYGGSPYCSNSVNRTVTRSGTAGGVYTSTPGLTIDASTGEITPTTSTPGTYVVTYTMAAANGCADQVATTSVTITQAPSATIAYAGDPFCKDDLTTKSVTVTGDAGGTFSVTPAGLALNASTGDIGIPGSTAGTYTVRYTIGGVGGCAPQIFTTTVTITNPMVVAPIVASPGTTITLPGSPTTSLSCATPGGTWSSSNTAVATVSAAGLVTGVSSGTTVISYTIPSGTCPAMTSTAINVLTAGGVSLWLNDINDANPSATNPFTSGQVVNGGVTVSGIGRSASLTATSATNRFAAANWTLSTVVDATKYISFTITPASGYAINFRNFIFTGQSSGTGPTDLTVRYSSDNFATVSNTLVTGFAKTGGTVSLSIPGLQNITGPTSFRIYGVGATNTGGTFSVNDFEFRGDLTVTCPSPNTLEFVNPPSDVPQDQAMSIVTVRAFCSSGNVTGAGFSGPIALSVNTGCGYVSQVVNAVNGVASFNNIIFTRSVQSGVTLQAVAAGFSPVTSNPFMVTAPTGTPPAPVTIVSEDFESVTPSWAWAVGASTIVGTGGSAGAGTVTKKVFAANTSLCKSYSVDNSAGERGATNTTTFSNVAIPATSAVTFNFTVGSLGTGTAGSGVGNDVGEDMLVDISLDGGVTWERTLTYAGYSGYLFPISTTPVTALSYNANAHYGTPSNKSAFSVALPTGSTQFRFRFTATNNRTNENWAIDNLSLVGVAANVLGVPRPLPVVTNNIIGTCPGTNTTITVVTANTIGVASYVWTPNLYLNNNIVSNPVANPPAAQVYNVTVTDANGCQGSGTVSLTMPGGTAGTWTGTSNTDWFQCDNWGGGFIPTTATDVTINASALNSAEIDPASTFAAAYSGIASANNITVSNGKILLMSHNAVLNMNGNLNIQTAALLDMTSGGLLNIKGNWNNSVGPAGFISGVGTVNYESSMPQTIAPENYYNLTSTGSAIRAMPAGPIGIAGTFTKGASNYIFNSANTVDFNGSLPQDIPAFKANVDPELTGSTYSNLTLSNAETKSLTGHTDIEGILTVTGSADLKLNANHFTLKSSSAHIAMVAPVTTSAVPAVDYNSSGRFVVERYFPARRAWRLITAPITADATKSLFNSWQTGGLSVAGSGTYITGSNGTWPGAGSGLDASPLNNISLRTVNNGTGAYVDIVNTKTTRISGTAGVTGVPDNLGYFMFVRGDRSPANFTVSNSNVTTLRDTGKIQIGQQIFTLNSPTLGYALIGNPYASSVDITNIIIGNTTGIDDNFFYLYDPNLQEVGAFLTMTNTGSGYTSVPSSPSGYTANIQSSQAFFVRRINTTASFRFQESQKTAVANFMFRPAANPRSIKANLFTGGTNGNGTLLDGNMVMFDNSYSSRVDLRDALKFSNINENFGLSRGSSTLSVERRPLIVDTDTLFLKLTKTIRKNYRFEFITEGLNAPNLAGYLEDQFLNTSTPISLNGTTVLDFDITAQAASAAADRFRIVFKPSVKGLAVTAVVQQTDVAVKWTLAEETNMDHYDVERSVNGTDFTSINIQASKSDSRSAVEYNTVDPSLAPGDYYYRIKATGKNAVVSYSAIIKVTIGKAAAQGHGLYVYPNPVKNNQVTLQMQGLKTGLYQFNLLNALGQSISKGQFMHNQAASSETVTPQLPMVAGNYNLSITGPDKNTTMLKVIVVQ